jgi:FHS family L-fucose permease-like MFS transporter
MAIVGGAIVPMLMGWIADISSMALGFIVPLACFVYISYFGLKGYKVRNIVPEA